MSRKTRNDEWIGGRGMPGARLVRMETGEKSQSINICRSSNVLGEYEDTYDIEDPSLFLSVRDLASSRTIDELVAKVRRHYGKKREGRPRPRPNLLGGSGGAPSQES